MVSFTFFITRFIAPNHPNPEKLTSYECGEEPTGNAWLPFNTRFYVIALVFLLFDVEMVFIFPWAIVFGSHTLNEIDSRWSVLSLIEMFVFLGILILGLAYVWVKGDLNWIKPDPLRPVSGTNIPTSFYDKLNEEQSAYKVKAFTADAIQVEPASTADIATASSPPITKPMFKPTFKKPGNE